MLTDRQLDYMRCVAEGRTLRETASMMGATPASVIDIARQARSALGARNAAHAVAICYRSGIPILVEDSRSVASDRTALKAMTPLFGGPVKRNLFEALADVYPRAATTDFLLLRMYPDGNEPERSDMTLRTLLSQIRREIRPLGWCVPKARYGVREYRLARTE